MNQIKAYSALFFKKIHMVYVHMANINKMVNMCQALHYSPLHGLSHVIPTTINNCGSLDCPQFSVTEIQRC